MIDLFIRTLYVLSLAVSRVAGADLAESMSAATMARPPEVRDVSEAQPNSHSDQYIAQTKEGLE